MASRTSNRRKNKQKKYFLEDVKKITKNTDEMIQYFINEIWREARASNIRKVIFLLEIVHYCNLSSQITLEYNRVMEFIKDNEGKNFLYKNFFWESPYKLKPINKLAYHELTPYSMDD